MQCLLNCGWCAVLWPLGDAAAPPAPPAPPLPAALKVSRELLLFFNHMNIFSWRRAVKMWRNWSADSSAQNDKELLLSHNSFLSLLSKVFCLFLTANYSQNKLSPPAGMESYFISHRNKTSVLVDYSVCGVFKYNFLVETQVQQTAIFMADSLVSGGFYWACSMSPTSCTKVNFVMW